jgi:hypothetical protein
MIPALGVSVLTVAVVLQLLDAGVGRAAARLTASAVGFLMLVEGALVLLASPSFADPSGVTAATHGVAMIVAGSGIWGIAYRSLWSPVSSGKR